MKKVINESEGLGYGLPKSITLDDILHRKRFIIELVNEYGMDIPDDIDGYEFKKIWDRWLELGGESNYYFAVALRDGLNKYLLGKDKKKTVKISESQLKDIISKALKENAFDVYGAAVDKHEMDMGFRNRYGIGQDWPHYDSEEYENGIWVDDEGRAWTVFAGDNRATCIDCEKEYGFEDDSLGEAKTIKNPEKTVKISESQLKNIIRESVKRMLKEDIENNAQQFKEMLFFNDITPSAYNKLTPVEKEQMWYNYHSFMSGKYVSRD